MAQASMRNAPPHHVLHMEFFLLLFFFFFFFGLARTDARLSDESRESLRAITIGIEKFMHEAKCSRSV